MENGKSFFTFIFILGFLFLGSAICAQTDIPLKQISPDIPADVRSQIIKLRSFDPKERTSAAYRLREMKTRAIPAIPYLIELMGDDTPLKWASGRETTPGEEAAQALGYEMGKAAFDPLVAVITHDSPVVRENAIWALSEIALRMEIETKEKINAPHVVALLISALNDKSPNVRLTAAWALRRINDKRATEPLITVLTNRSLSSLQIIPRGFVSRMGVYADIRRVAASGLGFVGDPRAVDPLIAAMQDDNPRIREDAAEALGRIGDPRAYDPLIKALKDKDVQVIGGAARGLGHLGDPRAINALESLLKDNSFDHFSIDFMVRSALEKLKAKAAEASKPIKPLGDEPLDAQGYFNRGLAHRENQELDKAIADYTRSIELAEDREREIRRLAFHNRANCWLLKNKYDQAIADYSRAIEIRPHALTFVNRGIALKKSGKMDAARQDFLEALEVDPRILEASLELGSLHLDLNEYDQAIGYYDTAIRNDPRNANAFGLRGLAFRGKGNAEKAIADFSEAIRINPKDNWAYVQRAIVRNKKGQADLAVLDSTAALQIDPNNIRALETRAEAYRMMGKFDEAITDANRLLQIEPNHAYTLKTRAEANRGKGNFSEAIADANKALKIKSDDPFALRTRAAAFWAQRQYDEAILDATRALEIEPKNLMALKYRADSYRMKRQYNEAIQDADVLLNNDPNNAFVLRTRAAAYRMKGENDLAIRDFKRSLEIEPGNDFAIKNLAEAEKQRALSSGEGMRADLPDWEKALKTDTIKGYEEFLQQHPHSSFAEKAKGRIVDLEVSNILRSPHGQLPSSNKISEGGSRTYSVVNVHNNTQYNLTIRYSGPDSFKVVFSPNEKGSIEVLRGSFKVAASVDAPNVKDYAGDEKSDGGNYEVEYYLVTTGPLGFSPPRIPRISYGVAPKFEPWPKKRIVPLHLK